MDILRNDHNAPLKSMSWIGKTKKCVPKQNVLFLLVLAIGYFFLIRQYLPNTDDIGYRFEYSIQGNSYVPMNTFASILHSQYVHYMYWTGRALAHTFVFYFCQQGNEWLFFLISTCFFVGFVIYICRLLPTTSTYLYIPALLLFLLIAPMQGTTLFGCIAYVVGYVYGLFLSAWILYYWEKFYRISELSNAKLSLLFVGAIICGCWHEGFSIPIVVGLGVYCLKNYKSVIKNKALWAIFIGYIIGTALVVFAPGNFRRLGIDGAIKPDVVYVLIQLIKHVTVVKLALAIFIVQLLWDIFHRQSNILSDCLYWTIVLTTIIFAAFVRYSGPHQLMVIALADIVLISRTINRIYITYVTYFQSHSRLYQRSSIAGCFIVIAFLVYGYIQVYSVREQIYKQWQEFCNEILASSDGVIINTPFEVTMDKYHTTWMNQFANTDFTTSYIYSDVQSYKTLSAYLTNGKNLNAIKLILPNDKQSIILLCQTNENYISDNIYYDSDLHFYVVKVPIESLSSHSYTIVLNQKSTNCLEKFKDKLKHRQYRQDTMQLDDTVIRYFDDEDYRYYVFYLYASRNRYIDEMYLALID